MPQQSRPNSGALFKNARKEQDSHPDYEGSCVMDDGREYWISAWIKQPKDATKKKFMSLSFKPKGAPKTAQKTQQQNPKPTHSTPPPPPSALPKKEWQSAAPTDPDIDWT